jgi:hypothetical protein
MSDYVCMKNLLLKNQIMTPAILDKVRAGNLSLQDLQTEESPLQELYRNTYKYLEFPPDLTPPARQLARELGDNDISMEANNLIRTQNAW